MPYSAEISRRNPSCFVFIIDQSASMLDVLDPTNIQPLDKTIVSDGRTYTHTAQGRTKAQAVADAINRLLQNLTIKCTKSEGVADYYHVGVIGYGGQVGPAFTGALAGRELAAISEVANAPARIDERTKKADDGAGGVFEQKVKFPIWFDAVGNNGTPMCSALGQAQVILSRWLAQNPNCFPPVVIHITDGESTDGDPANAMAQLKSLASTDGNVLLFNLHLSGSPAVIPITFPNNEAQLPNQYARTLFEGSSQLTPFMCTLAQEQGNNISEGAKGFVLNGDITVIVQALEIGTLASNALR